jgi:ADP-heptose:LPS heptosyltransferase
MDHTHKGQKQTRLYSFQISPTSEEIELMARHGICNLASEIKDFSIMAAALSMMDHMLSVDSAPAHLAGALNVPTTLLVPPRIDWRWGTKEQRPPWYSSLQVKEQMRFK